MAEPYQGWKRRRLLHAVAGLETGVLAGFAMLVWLIAGAGFQQQPWWAVPNLMASGLYGDAIFRAGPGIMTLAGAALHLVVSGSVGALFGLVVPESVGYLRLALLGLGAGLFWYYLSASPQWNKLSPLLPLYTLRPVLYSGHLLYGALLPLIRLNYRSLSRQFSPAPEQPLLTQN